MDAFTIPVVVIAAISMLIWLGLALKPAAFPPYAPEQPAMDTTPLPKGLPKPVDRFYRLTYGENIPVINSAVLSGRGKMRLFGLLIPIRFRFTHEVGQSFRHDIDLTFFGRKVLNGFETFIDGRGWAKTPGGIEEGAAFDQGSNVSLWAEALNWFPAVLLTDARVRWQAVDEDCALLIVPFGAGSEVFVVRFEPGSGALKFIEAMKYNSIQKQKMLWFSGVWYHEKRPWLMMDVEESLFNVAVAGYIRAPRP